MAYSSKVCIWYRRPNYWVASTINCSSNRALSKDKLSPFGACHTSFLWWVLTTTSTSFQRTRGPSLPVGSPMSGSRGTSLRSDEIFSGREMSVWWRDAGSEHIAISCAEDIPVSWELFVTISCTFKTISLKSFYWVFASIKHTLRP